MEPTAPTGLLASFRVLGDGLAASLQDRLELFSVEMQEEKFRLIQTFIWISAAVFAGMMALAFASLTLVYFCPPHARLGMLGGLTFLSAASLATIVVTFRRYLARQPKPFAATLHELAEDRACIRPAS